jgi:hypothetical protein
MNSKDKYWKKEYLRILTSNAVAEKDWLLASELIKDDYANGKIIWSNETIDEKIGSLIWEGVTTKGRLFADTLKESIDKSSAWYKVKMALFIVGGWVFGLITQITVEIFKCT